MPEISHTRVDDRYSLKEEVGRGGFAIVYKCINIKTQKEFAAKVFKKEKLTDRDLYKIEKEVLICGKLYHSHIVRLHEVMSDANYHFLIFDLVTGGELFDDLVNTKEGSYTEVVTARCMFQLMDAIAYCHSIGVIHRDLKPENILLESRENKIIKVADFGLAVELEKNETKWLGIAGTTHYMAPEVIEMTPYGHPVDCWGCGVIMFILLTGFMPFHHEDERRLNNQIKTGDYDLQHKTWETVSMEGKDLVQKLLCVVPGRRITADQALKHPWFGKMKSSKESALVRSDTIERLRILNAKRKMKALIRSNTFISSFMTWKKKEKVNQTSRTSSTPISKGPRESENKKKSNIDPKK